MKPKTPIWTLLIISFIAFNLAGCGKDEIKDNDYKQDIKNKLLGLWIEFYPREDSLRTYEFTEQDSIIQKHLWYDNDNRLSYYFQIIAKDSIKVIRDWEVEESIKETTHKLTFYSNDTLKIKQFLPVLYGLTGFEDVKLYKTE